jgi:hypothetical protein
MKGNNYNLQDQTQLVLLWETLRSHQHPKQQPKKEHPPITINKLRLMLGLCGHCHHHNPVALTTNTKEV